MKRRIILMVLFLGISLLLVGCFEETPKEPNLIEEEPTIVQIQNEITDVYKKVSYGCVGVYASNGNTIATGSGVVYKNDNGLYYVVTNNHVIEGKSSFRIYRGGTKYYRSTLVGTDPTNDIAVLTFSLDLYGGDEVYVQDIFNYEEELVIPGQTVLAIGCPISMDYYNTLTTGVVSRTSNGWVQTNAEMNPGNSGGGLFNLAGRLIGLVTQKEIYIKEGTDKIPAEGIGFAISLDVVASSIQAIEKTSTVVMRPTLGCVVNSVNRYLAESSIYLNYLPNTIDQALIVTSISNGPALLAGLKVNDVILKVDGHDVITEQSLEYFMRLKNKGDSITLTVYRSTSGKEGTITFNL